MANTKRQQVTGWVMELSKGRFLHINATDDGNGTWWDDTPSIWEAYWYKDLADMKNVASLEFSNFPQGYPKYHKVRFTAQVLATERD